MNNTHGMSKTRIYRAWVNMKARCFDSKGRYYHNYGGRGITVCMRWARFENFYDDMGDVPEGKTLDRIDNDGNYEKSNCRWATPKEQQRNTRSNRFLEFNGLKLTLSEWSRKKGISRQILRYRLESGWSAEKALNTPSLSPKIS